MAFADPDTVAAILNLLALYGQPQMKVDVDRDEDAIVMYAETEPQEADENPHAYNGEFDIPRVTAIFKIANAADVRLEYNPAYVDLRWDIDYPAFILR